MRYWVRTKMGADLGTENDVFYTDNIEDVYGYMSEGKKVIDWGVCK